jgi:hypothetical protein
MSELKLPKPQTFSLNRRTFLLGGMALSCSGCALVDTPALNDLKSMWQILSGTLPEIPITRSQITKLPYATMRAKIGRGPRGLLALGKYKGRDLHWYSKDAALFVTRGGRIVQTAGLPENLKRTDLSPNDPVQFGLPRMTGPVKYIRWIDTDFENRYQLKIESKIELIRREKITILDRQYDTLLGREINRVPDIGWKFTNTYWADEQTGFIWKSRQYIARTFGPVEFEVLKPAAPPTPVI